MTKEVLQQLNTKLDKIKQLCNENIISGTDTVPEIKKLVKEIQNELPLPCSSHCNKCKNGKVFA